MPFQIVREDIVRLQVDAVVNAANEHLQRGGGVCGAIFAAAGVAKMQAACDAIGHCNTGESVATPAFELNAKHVIHTVGPIWRGGANGEAAALHSCYRSALKLAYELGDTSIASPLISSGIYGYPKEQAIDIALDEIRTFLATHEMEVYLTVFDAASMRASLRRFDHIAEYIDNQYVYGSPYARRNRWEQLPPDVQPSMLQDASYSEAATDSTAFDAMPAPSAPPMAAPSAKPGSARFGSAARSATTDASQKRESVLKRLIKNLDASFSTTLMRMIDERGLKDSEVYKRANMSRQHFSKIRGNRHYKPKKQTVLALAIALKLSLDETRLLLERAGFALTHADERDVIVEYFITTNNYDIYEINLALYAFDQPLLG